MPVAHQPLAAIIGSLVGMAAEQGRNLGLDGLRQQRTRAVAQNLGQRIGKSSWLRKLENITVGHGVSLLRWRSGGFSNTPTIRRLTPSYRHQLSCIALSSGLEPCSTTVRLGSWSKHSGRQMAGCCDRDRCLGSDWSDE